MRVRVRRLFRNTAEAGLAFWKSAGLKGAAFWLRRRRLAHLQYSDREPPKAVTRKSRWITLARCWVHLIPICATVVLASINLCGLYVGGDYEGPHPRYSREINVLILQATAKLIELLVVASLSTILEDLVRFDLTNDGLPFGMIAVHVNLAQVSYYWSPDLWCAQKAIANKWRRFSLLGFILLCGVVATAVGPSAAVLLLPSQTDNWPAGSCDYYLAGNDTYLWPEVLDQDAIGLSWHSTCLDPPADGVASQSLRFGDTSCIWGRYRSLQSAYRDAAGYHIDNLTITDSAVTHTLQRVSPGQSVYGQAFTLAPNIGATAASYYIGQEWRDTINSVKGISSQAHFKRQTGGPIFRMSSYMPLVRTQCISRFNNSFHSPAMWEYPFFPVTGSADHLYYKLPAGSIANSSWATVRWRDVPTLPSMLSNNVETSYYPSAFLDVQMPHNGSWVNGTYLTCSVDARWVQSDNVGIGFINHIQSSYSVYGAMPNERVDFPFTSHTRPEHGAVQMTRKWLDTLAPSINDSRVGYNTLAGLVDPLTAWFLGQELFVSEVQSMVATAIADGMSRIGYSRNGGGYTIPAYAGKVFDRYDYTNTNFSAEVYKGGAVLPPPKKDGQFDNDIYDYSNSTKLTWRVSIPGYYYKADAPGKWIPLGILLLHAVIAAIQIIWRLVKGETSDSWDSVPELLALAQNSRPTAMLSNASASIWRGRTFARTARIRSVTRAIDSGFESSETSSYEGEQLQLLFDDYQDSDARTAAVNVDEEYGEL